MPLTAEERRELDAVKALAFGLQRTVATLTTRVETLEKQGLDLGRIVAAAENVANTSQVLGEINAKLKPLAEHAGNILAVQAGSLGVRK